MKKNLGMWIPVAAMCVAIFLFSQDMRSEAHSDHILLIILALFHSASAQHLAELAYPFRKFAHVVVYSLLALITYRALRGGRRAGFYPPVALRTVVFCLLYASSDEIHQIFVPGRGPAVHDVLLDGLAATMAMILLQGWHQLRSGPRELPKHPIPESRSMAESPAVPAASPVSRG